jgi:hypothetical protein
MKRILVLTLGLLVAPAVVSAQVEIGLDAGLSIEMISDVDDNFIGFAIPSSGMRVGFMAGEQIIVETRLGVDYLKFGDTSGSSVDIAPGINFLVNDQFYVRGEAGLSRSSFDDGTGSVSSTQYLFGGAVGIRRPLGDGAVLRLEGGVDRWLENSDDFIPASTEIRLGVGVSAVVGG